MNMRITIEVTEEKEYEIEHDEDYWICDGRCVTKLTLLVRALSCTHQAEPSTILSIYLRTVGSPKTSWCVPLEVTTQYGDTKVKKNDEVDTST
jgi:hypothetical protein